MASISPPTPHKLSFKKHKFLPRKRQFYPSSTSSSIYSTPSLCRCSTNASDDSSSSSIQWPWNAPFQGVIGSAMKKIESFFNNNDKKEEHSGNNREKDEISEEDNWDWDRWRKHFDEVDDQERIVTVLKSQLGHAVNREDYEDAARLKVAIAAAATNDVVGRVMSQLNRAVAEERYQDAALLRDNAGAGLVGWWSGMSEDEHDPYGLIIRITAEHGRFVARSYSPRQLATAAVGSPVFEIFLTKNKKGDFKQQAVYLKRKGLSQDPSTVSSKAPGAPSRMNPPGPTEEKSDLFVVSTEDTDDGDETEDGSDIAEGLPGFQNILRDMVPGVKVKVLKVTTSSKVDRDFISKVIEQIMDEEDEEEDTELQSVEAEDESSGESDQEKDEIEMDAVHGIIEDDGPSEISVKVVVGGLAQKFPGSVPSKESLRVPAKLEKKGRWSFSFSIEKDVNQQDPGAKGAASVDRKAKLQGQRSADSIMLDLAKFIGQEKIPMKVLKDVRDLINFTLSQAQNRQPLSGSTTFHRIETSASPDPLNGLYIGAHGLYTSEVIHLQRKFGQWQDDRGTKEPSNLEFYEYVEAVKLTGDPYVPAGQVAFRAKVGKRYQLPHRGIIPEEFGVIARYKGQGRLAEPGFQNPRWVDGELVVLDGKYIKGGPVVGFVYWAPEYHFLVFFNRLRLQ
ncbi:protein EXECUTER 1, chloroplastic [Ricinus communis]|uniref:EXECUTER1 protein, chloroplast, putative n=1 Tax=Ricinus communis TaxID=3988 RepID=B9T3E6_RICCO|nr:protein EXECUTER 1, chloroplastic [Ricinus communis]XP_015583090.1 protein EXECUTER 1, chloroplastic [Ricinus communis]XP_048231510.1 protein EXECUTER 1, chloroplastic [Ricinus communis]EEF29622.1 EXECUTER1 protein, chloroplast precursor, putative [Ricinus communis]|eukprot:XP_002532765.1 protein EXECUTER 1, chloroplastic [Ricinus communis]